MHIYINFVHGHLIVETYNECWVGDIHDGHSMVLYYPIDLRNFKKIHGILHNGLNHMLITYKLHCSKNEG